MGGGLKKLAKVARAVAPFFFSIFFSRIILQYTNTREDHLTYGKMGIPTKGDTQKWGYKKYGNLKMGIPKNRNNQKGGYLKMVRPKNGNTKNGDTIKKGY